MSDTAPCPWCEDGGKPFGHINRHPFFSVTIKCHKCFAEGPHVKFNPTPDGRPGKWEDIVAEARAEAEVKWNERVLPVIEIFAVEDEPQRKLKVV